jgi:CRP-like cAMP-binding protein
VEGILPETLKQYSYFAGLSEGALEDLAKKLQLVKLPAGSIIIKEGEPADSFYLVKDGEVEVLKSTKFGQSAKITNLKCGQEFGEMALLTCSTRNSTITAVTDVVLFKLLKSDFDEIIELDSAFVNMLIDKIHDRAQYNRLKTLQPFALLEPEKMLALTEKLEEI